MLTIKTTPQHPRPAIYYGTEWLRDVGEDLNRARQQVKAANRVLAYHQGREARIEAGKRALALCGQLGPSRERLTKKTMIDRKSTRLNSSHVAISYAVFCLKKKKKSNRKSIQST